MEHKKYRLCDLCGIIGEFDTCKELFLAVNLWKARTSGECDLMIFRWNEQMQNYSPAVTN